MKGSYNGSLFNYIGNSSEIAINADVPQQLFFRIFLTGTNEKEVLMLFSSSTFILFFLPIVLIIYYIPLMKQKNKQNTFLFLASLLFYAWGEPKYLFLMLLSIFINYKFGLLVDKYRTSKWKSSMALFLTILYNIAILFLFKYLTFTIININSTLHKNYFVPEIPLPIGISFFTFQAISYVVDVYRGEGKVQKKLMQVGLYITFFPQLIAGPIIRYETIALQIESRRETFAGFSEGVIRFIRGLSKKVLLSNTLAIIADKAFSTPESELSVSFAWLGIFAYSFQILFDFSGYSEMAIGLGKMFGFELVENFNYPYISKSISEFWRRWHISLGTWFRDYIYFPLGGSRVRFKARVIFNLFIVWSLTGLWHGSNWTFILWGILYFILIAFEKVLRFHKSNRFQFLQHVYTLFFVMIGWVLFRSENIGQASNYLSVMFFHSGNAVLDNTAYFYFSEYAFFFIAAFLCATPFFQNLSNKYFNKVWFAALYPFVYILLFIISLSYIVKGSYNPFIYFNF